MQLLLLLLPNAFPFIFTLMDASFLTIILPFNFLLLHKLKTPSDYKTPWSILGRRKSARS